MRFNKDTQRAIAALAVGVAYGLIIRIGFEWKALHPFLQIVSTAFLIVCPLSVGAIAVLWGAGAHPVSAGRQVGLSVASMLLFLTAMFLTLLEGLLCIVLVGPVFLIASIVGGLIAGFVHNRFRVTRSTLPVVALLPLLVAPIEGTLPLERSEQVVTNKVYISAPPEVVFDHLANVRDIRRDELGFAFVHLIGLPRPIQAEMSGTGEGSTRISRWEKNVTFQEIITEWRKPFAMRYRFIIPPGSIPRDALDRHVEMGGEYFDLIDGGYDLKATSGGGTELILTTRFVNKSQLKLYGDLWGRMVLKDFHQSILGLMKARSEKAHNLSLQPMTSGGS